MIYVVEQGDWLAKIADEHDTTVAAIWNHPANAAHRAKRGSPDVLYPGDVLHIPVPGASPPGELPPIPPPAELPPWPYPPYDFRDQPLPSWECPAGQCECHPDDGARMKHTIVLHDVHGERCGGARCRVYEGRRLITSDPTEANGEGEVEVEIRPSCQMLFIEWAPSDVPAHPRLPYRKRYHVRLGTTGARRNALRLANLGFQKRRFPADNIKDYQRAYHQTPSGVRQHVHDQVRERHDDQTLPPFAKGEPPEAAPGAGSERGAQDSGVVLTGGADDENVPDTPTQSGSTVPNAAHLTVGVSDPGRSIRPENVRIVLHVKSIAPGVITTVLPNTLLSPDNVDKTPSGAAFLFKHVPEGIYDALAFVINPGDTFARKCGRLRITIGTADAGGHKFVDMTVAPYQLTLVGPSTAKVGTSVSVAARGTVGPVLLWTSSDTTVGTITRGAPPLAMDATYSAVAAGTSTVEATDLGGQRAPLTITSDCIASKLIRDKILATGIDGFLLKSGIKTTLGDSRLPRGHVLGFSNDSLHSTGRKIPHPPEASQNEAALKSSMKVLLTGFAHADTKGMALRLFDAFQAPNHTFTFYDDPDLNTVCDSHPHIETFIQRTLNDPAQPGFDATRVGIHQMLAVVGFDVNVAAPVHGLQPPALNRGKNPSLVPPAKSTEDRANGLFVMINGLQHAVVVAKDYEFDACKKQYEIDLEFNFYDVFGLDDEDLRVFGIAGRGNLLGSPVTSWWQLQHQFDYVPLITRVILRRKFTVPTP